MFAYCPHCQSQSIVRVPRRMREKLHRIPAVWFCRSCGRRIWKNREKFCWRCGSDLDRRHRSQWGDYLMAALWMRPYTCRRCARRRYRWG